MGLFGIVVLHFWKQIFFKMLVICNIL